MKLSKYSCIYADACDQDSAILFSTKRASAVQIDRSILTDLEKGQVSGEDRQTLIDLGFLVANHEEERQEMLRYIDELNEIDPKLSVIVALNMDCNLACTYCFEGSRKGKHYMSPETADHVIHFIERNQTGRELLNVTFYGGEPLLSAGLIASMAERLKTIAAKKGLEFMFQLVTNGTLLTPEMASRLKPFGLKEASVTVDGCESSHNLARPFKSGSGSFTQIIENLKAVCGMIDINVGGNFTEANYREFPELLDYMLANGITPEKILSVKFDPVFGETAEYAPPEMTGACRSPNEPWIFEAAIYLREEIMKRGFKTGGIQPVVCAIDLHNRHIIDYDGNIYKCTGFFGRKDFITGNVKTGVKDNGSMYNLDNWKNEECLSCKYLPLCFGGCRYMKFVRDGNINGVDCRKPYYDACLEALVKQDLRYPA